MDKKIRICGKDSIPLSDLIDIYICKGIECLSQTLTYNLIHYDLKYFKKLMLFFSNNLSLKYQRFTPSGSSDKGIGKFKFLAKT